MKSSLKIVLAITTLSVIVIAAVYSARRDRSGHILSEVSDEGYETAYDILFPGNNKGGSNLHYGPVLPHN